MNFDTAESRLFNCLKNTAQVRALTANPNDQRRVAPYCSAPS